MWEVILDAFLDTLKVMPILYLVYLLVSYLGHNNNNKYAKFMSKTKKFGPLLGSAVGVVPQCGFSVVMADLYSKRAITLGTLVAVMVATSDEAIPLMISNPKYIVPMLVMIAIKFVCAILFGYLIDLTLKLFRTKQETKENAFEQFHNHDCELTTCSITHVIHGECCEDAEEDEHHGHKHEHGDCVHNIFLDALLHTLQISAFLLVASLIIGFVVEYAGIENLQYVFTSNKFIQPFIAGLVGLIPSCASSVFLVEFFMAGGISFGAMMAGLCAGSGIGIVVLFVKNKKKIWQNIATLLILYLIGCLVGLVCNLIF